MRRRLAMVVAGFVVLAVMEVLVLIAVGQLIGLGWALLLLLITSAIGGNLLRGQGGRAWRAFRADLQSGRPPGHTATDGLLVLFGGVLMLVPGFITDVIGLLCLLPQTRRLPRSLLMRLVAANLSPAAATSLFGPRRVRVRYGPAQHSAESPPTPGVDEPDRRKPPAIEGEIIDPDH
jgi:UPF0716 protein FxsA